MSEKIAVLYTTISDLTAAKSLARKAVEGKYAACVNIIPSAISCYEWEGKVETAEEVFLLFKTSTSKLTDLKEWLLTEHPYTTPAVLSTEVSATFGFFKYVEDTIKA
jgi:periplasmic divalent cation tolerance protein